MIKIKGRRSSREDTRRDRIFIIISYLHGRRRHHLYLGRSVRQTDRAIIRRERKVWENCRFHSLGRKRYSYYRRRERFVQGKDTHSSIDGRWLASSMDGARRRSPLGSSSISGNSARIWISSCFEKWTTTLIKLLQLHRFPSILVCIRVCISFTRYWLDDLMMCKVGYIRVHSVVIK